MTGVLCSTLHFNLLSMSCLCWLMFSRAPCVQCSYMGRSVGRGASALLHIKTQHSPTCNLSRNKHFISRNKHIISRNKHLTGRFLGCLSEVQPCQTSSYDARNSIWTRNLTAFAHLEPVPALIKVNLLFNVIQFSFI